MADSSQRVPGNEGTLRALVFWAVTGALGAALVEVVCAASFENALLEALRGGERARLLALLLSSFPVTAVAALALGGLGGLVGAGLGRGLAAAGPGVWIAAGTWWVRDELRGPAGGAVVAGALAVALVAGLLAASGSVRPRPGLAWGASLLALAALAFGRGPIEGAQPVELRALARSSAQANSPDAPRADGAPKAPGLTRPVARNMLVLLVDTLRSDHLGCYGYGRETSPNVDRLAAEGVLFEQALTPKPKTSPAVASLFVGKWPQTHRIYQTGIALPDEHATIAEVFREAGYATFGAAANINISPHFNFDQGFDAFVQVRPEGDPQASQDGRVAEAFEAWLAEREAQDEGGAPFYAYLHFIDPHSHYIAPEPFRDMFQGDDLDGRLGDSGLPINPHQYFDGIHKTVFQEELGSDLDRYVARYDGEIRYTDKVVGDVLALLERRGLADSTAVVFTADHGESMAEHDVYFNHGLTTYEEQLRIPMILRAPGLAAGARRREQVSLVDLMPTVLDLMGLEVPAAVEGRPFTAWLLPDAPPGDAGPTFASATALRQPWMRTVRDGGFKLTVRNDGVRPERVLDPSVLLVPGARARYFHAGLRNYELAEQLFDLEADPDELRNLAWSGTPERMRLFGLLARFRSQAAPGGPLQRHLPSEGSDEGVLQDLRDLGYIDIDDDVPDGE